MVRSIGVRIGFIIFTLVSTSLIVEAASLKGNWTWSEHITPGDSSIQQLEFFENHKVAGFSFLPHVFSGIGSGGGEALESEAYTYRLSKNTIVFHSRSGFGSGWPGRHGVEGKIQRCGFSFGANRNYFVLSDCDLAGDWHLMPQD